MEDTRRTKPSESIKSGSWNHRNWRSKHLAYTDRSVSDSCHINYNFQFVIFKGLFSVQVSVPLILCLLLGIFSFCWVALSILNLVIFFLLYLIIFHFVMFICYHLEVYSVLMRAKGWVDLEGRSWWEKLHWVEGGEVVIRKRMCLK